MSNSVAGANGNVTVSMSNLNPGKQDMGDLKKGITNAVITAAADIKEGKSVNSITKKIFLTISGIVGSVAAIAIIYIIQQYAMAYFSGDTTVFTTDYIKGLLFKSGLASALSKSNMKNLIVFIKQIMTKYFHIAYNAGLSGVQKVKNLTGY